MYVCTYASVSLTGCQGNTLMHARDPPSVCLNNIHLTSITVNEMCSMRHYIYLTNAFVMNPFKQSSQ